MAKMKSASNDDTGRTVAYVVLGIVGVMAIVALVLLFNGARNTGQIVYYTGGAFSAADEGFSSVAGHRVGETPEPNAWEDRLDAAARGGFEAQQ